MSQYRFTNISNERQSLVQYGLGILEAGGYIDIDEINIRPSHLSLTLGTSPILSVSPNIPFDLVKSLSLQDILDDFSKAYPYVSNPVLTDTGAGSGFGNPYVIYDRDSFNGLLSYTHAMLIETTGGTDALAYAFSNDGITWTTPVKITTNLPTGAGYPTNPTVVFDKTKALGSGYYFQLWYKPANATTPIADALKTSYSNDMVTWTAPVSCGDLATGVAILGSIALNATAFNGFSGMLYNASGTSYTPAQIAAVPRRLLYAKYVAAVKLTKTNILSAIAYSNDGLEWALIYDDIILPAASPFDTHFHIDSLVKVGKYFVAFMGGGNGADNLQFGYAISDDLATWEYKGLLRNIGRIKRYNSQTTAMEAYPTNQLAATDADSLSGLHVIVDAYGFGNSIYAATTPSIQKDFEHSKLAAKFFWIEGNTTKALSYADNL